MSIARGRTGGDTISRERSEGDAIRRRGTEGDTAPEGGGNVVARGGAGGDAVPPDADCGISDVGERGGTLPEGNEQREDGEATTHRGLRWGGGDKGTRAVCCVEGCVRGETVCSMDALLTSDGLVTRRFSGGRLCSRGAVSSFAAVCAVCAVGV